jgi:DNA topoisomerase-2
VLSYNPVQIIDYITDVLESGESSRIVEPYYHGFKGDIVNLVSDGMDSVPKYLIKGVYNILSATEIEITELPVFLWTENFKQHLEKLLEAKNPVIKDYTDLCTDTEIHFKIKFVDDITSMHHVMIEYGCNKIEKLLKLYTTVNTSNMYLFNDSKCLVKFNTIYSIIKDHFKIRFEGYIARKQYYLGLLQDEIMRLRNKVNFINGNLDDTIDLRRKSKDAIDDVLTVGGFDRIDNNYNYLIKMSMDSVTQEKVDELTAKYEEKLAELDALEKKQPREIWLDELAELKEACIDIGINNNTPKMANAQETVAVTNAQETVAVTKTTKLKLGKPGAKLKKTTLKLNVALNL